MSNDDTVSPATQRRDRWAIAWILLLSGGALGFLVWLIYLRDEPEQHAEIFNTLPAVNAFLNALSACCLTAGYLAIRRRLIPLHATLMSSAFVFSALFLVTYIIYHGVHGDTRFTGEGGIRFFYFAILISHIALSAVTFPLILIVFYYAITKRFATHKKIARITLPLWIYVSVTGVLIFFLLRAHS
jgi:putative membrane protein